MWSARDTGREEHEGAGGCVARGALPWALKMGGSGIQLREQRVDVH